MTLQRAQIDAHVQSKYIPILVDNIFIGNPLLVKLMSKNKVMFDSGQNIRVPILYGKKKGGSYSGLDRFDINPVKTRNVAQWDWKGLWTNITIVGDDIDMIEGTEKILGLVENELKEAELKMKDMLSEQIFSTSVGTKDLNSLDQAIGSGDYGDITPADLGNNSTNKIWQSTLDTSVGATTLARMKGWMGECTYGTEIPDLCFTTQLIYDALWAQCQPQQRFLNPASVLAKVGFRGIEIDGMQILVDRHCPSGYIFGLNTDYFKFIIHKKKNFIWTSNKDLIDADAYVRQLLFKGNLICTSRRYQFKMTGATA